MNGGPATTNQVRDRGKNLKQKFWKWGALYKIFSQAISLVSVAPDNLGVRVRSKHTRYVYRLVARQCMDHNCLGNLT
jgi:hypothetical protein